MFSNRNNAYKYLEIRNKKTASGGAQCIPSRPRSDLKMYIPQGQSATDGLQND